jgi:hypothetical protein
MRVYTTRNVYPQTYTRGRGEVQRQAYVWHLHQEGGETKEKNNRHLTLEIRPGVSEGIIREFKLEVPFTTDFDVTLMNRWEHCDCHPSIDGTQAFRATVHRFAQWASNNLFCHQTNQSIYFSSHEKRMLQEKEDRHWPRRGTVTNALPGGTVGADETHIPEPIFVIDLEIDAGNDADGTVIHGEIWIEGMFPKHYLRSQRR